jgi:NADH:ubiquinone oxidoreductase subunit 6 (subunit J)
MLILLLLLSLCFLISLIFVFNRTIYSILALICCYFFVVCIILFLNLEFTALISIIVYLGGISIMFLFLILSVDIKEENALVSFNFSNFYISTFYSFIFSYFSYLLIIRNYKFSKWSWSFFEDNFLLLNINNEIFFFSYEVFIKNIYFLPLIGFFLFVITICSMILAINIFEKIIYD